MTGDTVHLSISTNHDRMSQERPDAVKVQSTDSQVSGRLGEWITLASNSNESVADQNGLAQRYSTQGRDDMIFARKGRNPRIACMGENPILTGLLMTGRSTFNKYVVI